MKNLGEFEIFDIFSIKFGIALAGKLISGGPISNDKDILQKNIFITFVYNEKEISKKILRLDSGFGRANLDTIIDKGENMALLIDADYETEILFENKLVPPIIGKIMVCFA